MNQSTLVDFFYVLVRVYVCADVRERLCGRMRMCVGARIFDCALVGVCARICVCVCIFFDSALYLGLLISLSPTNIFESISD